MVSEAGRALHYSTRHKNFYRLVILQFLRQFLGFDDVFVLSVFVAGAKQDDQNIALLLAINAVPWVIMDSQLTNASATGLTSPRRPKESWSIRDAMIRFA